MTWRFVHAGEVFVFADCGHFDEIGANAFVAQCSSKDLAMLFLSGPPMFTGALAKATDEIFVQVADDEL